MAKTYVCKILNNDGSILEKEIESENMDEARALISEMGARPLDVRPLKADGKAKNLANMEIMAKKVKAKDLSLFCKQMYTMLYAGMPLIKSLGIMYEQLEHPTLKKACGEMMKDVQKGLMFSDAMKRQTKAFPSLLISMVESGEMTGNQDEVLERMAVHYKKEDTIERKIKGALIYPKILAFLIVAVVVIMLTKIFPQFLSLFEGAKVELPWPTKFVMALSDSLVNRWYVYLIVIATVVTSFKVFLGTGGGRRMWDRFLLYVPYIKTQISKIATSRFTRTLSTLLSSGLPLLASLEMAGRVTGNTVVEDGVLDITEDIKKGRRLSTLISQIAVFPPMLVSMISIGEESGSLETMLERTSDFYDDELETSLSKMIGMIEPVMIVVMGTVVGFIVVAMMWPMMTLFKAFQ